MRRGFCGRWTGGGGLLLGYIKFPVSMEFVQLCCGWFLALLAEFDP